MNIDGLKVAQGIGLGFTLLLGASILLLSLIAAFTVSRNPLPTPDLKLSVGQTQEDKSKEIENYKNLTTALHSPATATFKLVVTDTLLPVFNTLLTALIGFIFVRKTAEVISTYLNRPKN
jgi:hypothetical protein